MEKGKIIGIVAVLAIIIIVGAVVGVVLLADPCANEEAVLKISGSGVNQETDLSLCHLQQNKYGHVTDEPFEWRNKANTTGTDSFTGVVVYDVLKGLINDEAANLEAEIIASDGYSRSFNLADIQAASDDFILAYGGEGFDAEEDGNLLLVVDLSFVEEGGVNRHLWIRDVVEISVTPASA